MTAKEILQIENALRHDTIQEFTRRASIVALPRSIHTRTNSCGSQKSSASLLTDHVQIGVHSTHATNPAPRSARPKPRFYRFSCPSLTSEVKFCDVGLDCRRTPKIKTDRRWSGVMTGFKSGSPGQVQPDYSTIFKPWSLNEQSRFLISFFSLRQSTSQA